MTIKKLVNNTPKLLFGYLMLTFFFMIFTLIGIICPTEYMYWYDISQDKRTTSAFSVHNFFGYLSEYAKRMI